MNKTNVRTIETVLFGDYIQEFTGGWARVCQQKDFRIRPFHERYGFQEDKIFQVCQEAGAYVTEQILRMVMILRDKYNESLENPHFEERKSSCLALTWEAINLLYTGENELRKNYTYSAYIHAYSRHLGWMEQLGKNHKPQN